MRKQTKMVWYNKVNDNLFILTYDASNILAFLISPDSEVCLVGEL